MKHAKTEKETATLLDSKDVCALLKIGRTKLTAMVNIGEFPAPKKLGRRNRWLLAVVEAWIESRWGEATDPERN